MRNFVICIAGEYNTIIIMDIEANFSIYQLNTVHHNYL